VTALQVLDNGLSKKLVTLFFGCHIVFLVLLDISKLK